MKKKPEQTPKSETGIWLETSRVVTDINILTVREDSGHKGVAKKQMIFIFF